MLNLDEPLKPFVQLGAKPFGIVYEGISTICFKCSVYGHVREHCPYASVENECPASDSALNGAVNPNLIKVDKVVEMSQAEDVPMMTKTTNATSTASTSSDVGPWMVMNYKNKKKNSGFANSRTKKFSPGSRFAPLQDVDDVFKTEVPASVGKEKQSDEPPIVKLWKNLQHKLKTGDPKLAKTVKPTAEDVSFRSPPVKSGAKKVPLTDISNVGSSSASGSGATKKFPKQHGALFKDKSTTFLVRFLPSRLGVILIRVARIFILSLLWMLNLDTLPLRRTLGII